MMKHSKHLLAALMWAAISSTAALGQGPLEYDAIPFVDEDSSLPAIHKRVPTSIDDFREIEAVAQQIASKALAATVGVQLGNAYASGVIVSSDGFVLTAAHVAGSPGRDVRLTLSDGRIGQGTTLGTNPDVDGAMIKLNDSGPWPFIPMADEQAVIKPGDWCIATGHPGGYERGRSTPVRLGRVISSNGYTLRSDCPIEPGDSGGPLIDLRGYVIGIHSRIYDDATGNLHVPITTYRRTWDQLKASQISVLSPASSFLAQFDMNVDGMLTLSELAAGPRHEMYRRLAAEFEFDVDQPQEINALRQRIGLDISKRRSNQFGRVGQMMFASAGESETLSEYHYTRGLAAMNVLRRVTEAASRWTVDVSVNGNDVAGGAIVDSDGWIVTKASQVDSVNRDPEIICHLFDSRRYRAELVHVDRQYDLAWLKIDAVDLPEVQWTEEKSQQAGQWVISTSRGRTPLSAGVISVAAREIKSQPGFMGIGGSPTRSDAYVESIVKESGAAASRLRLGDVIVAVNDVPVPTFQSLSTEVRRYMGGDIIGLKVRRDGQDRTVRMRLGHRIDPSGQSDAEMSGRLSDRRDGFPFAFTHDSVLQPEDCGGPLIDLSGKAVGINIARSQRSGSLALAPETIERLHRSVRQRFDQVD